MSRIPLFIAGAVVVGSAALLVQTSVAAKEAAVQAELEARLSSDHAARLLQEQDALPGSDRNVCPALTGTKLKDATVRDLEGNDVSLSAIYKEKATIFIVYRGGW